MEGYSHVAKKLDDAWSGDAYIFGTLDDGNGIFKPTTRDGTKYEDMAREVVMR